MALKFDWFWGYFRTKDTNGGGGGTPAGSNGYVQFNDNGSFGGDSAFIFDKINKRVGINSSALEFALQVDSGVGIVSQISGSAALTISNRVGSTSQLIFESAGDGAANRFNARRSRGTYASPTLPLSGDQLFRMGASAIGQSNRASFDINTAENWTATAKGTTMIFKLTKVGTNTQYDAIQFTDGGSIKAPEMYNTAVGGTNRDLYVDDSGLMGYVSSALKYKENLRDLTETDVKNIYKLPVKLFDFKDKSKGVNQLGTIADEVEQYFPQICSYKYQFVEEPEEITIGDEKELIIRKIPVLDEQGNHIKELETVQYSKIGLLALVAVKDLDERLKTLEAQ